jgi:hypothetical protein
MYLSLLCRRFSVQSADADRQGIADICSTGALCQDRPGRLSVWPHLPCSAPVLETALVCSPSLRPATDSLIK